MADPLLEPHKKKHEWTVFLDMDGVCTDFVSAAIRANDGDPVKVIAEWPEGEYDVTKVLGIPPDTFWKAVSDKGENFWRYLELYPWFWTLYYKLLTMADVVFLTSPSEDPWSASGKIWWLQDRFGRAFRNYSITHLKGLSANPRAILIDDFTVNVETYQNAGGPAVLFPQPWNGDGDLPEDRAAYVLDVVAATMKSSAGIQTHIKVSLLQASKMCSSCSSGDAPVYSSTLEKFVHDGGHVCDAQHVWEKVLDRC